MLVNNISVPHRSRTNTYESLKKAYDYSEESSAYYMSLNGIWDFFYLDSPFEVPSEFINGDYDKINWSSIEVPGHLEFQGYSQPIYSNYDFPFPLNEPNVIYQNPTGLYYKQFHYEKKLKKQILRFDGVESLFELWINGKRIGEGHGSRLMSEFDISEFLITGLNTIAVKVQKWSEYSFIEDQDMWWLSGIFRDVSIIEESVVADFKIRPFETNGSWYIDVSVLSEELLKGVLHVYDGLDLITSDFISSKEKILIEIKKPYLWTHETPHLYTCIFELSETIFIPIRIGLREIKMINNQVCLNGIPILFNGVNRHEFSPISGRTLTKDFTREELMKIKRNHMNSIRTAHYPNAPYFYDLCDELGLMVVDECDIETHGFTLENTPSNNTYWKEEYIQRGLRMVHRDYNHPCIVMWSLGNESQFGENLVDMAKEIRLLDNSRPIHYEGDRESLITDVYSTMYSSIKEIQTRASKKVAQKPHILCEYGHAMGNGPGSLEDYQKIFNMYDSVQGGFIWEWKDHGIRNEKDSSVYHYGGQFGETVHDGDFVIDGLVLPDGTPSPALNELKKVIQPVKFFYHNGFIGIKNLLRYKSTAPMLLEWEYLSTKDFNNYKKGTISVNEILPNSHSGLFDLLINEQDEGIINIILKVAEEDEIFQQGDIYGQEEFIYMPYKKEDQKINFIETEYDVSIKNNHFITVFNKYTGNMTSFIKNSFELLQGEMNLSLSRKKISNDLYIFKEWQNNYLNELYAFVENFEIVTDLKNSAFLLLIKQYIAPPVVSWGIQLETEVWFVNNRIEFKFSGCFEGEKPDSVPRIGWELPLKNDVTAVSWIGKGPSESYPDSDYSTLFGKYSLQIEDWAFPYIVPQESGNRSKVRSAEFFISNGESVQMDSVNNMNINVTNLETNLNASYKFIKNPTLDNTIIRIDPFVRGLGSNSCGPEPLDHFKLKTLPFKASFSLK